MGQGLRARPPSNLTDGQAEETLFLPFPHWFRVRGYLSREMLILPSCSTTLQQQPTLSQIQQVKSYDEGKEAWDLEASS